MKNPNYQSLSFRLVKLLTVVSFTLTNFYGPAYGITRPPQPQGAKTDRLVVYVADANDHVTGTLRFTRGEDGSFNNLEICDSRLEVACYSPVQSADQREFQAFQSALNKHLAIYSAELKRGIPERLAWRTAKFMAYTAMIMAGLGVMSVPGWRANPRTIATIPGARFFGLTTPGKFWVDAIKLAALDSLYFSWIWAPIGFIKVKRTYKKAQGERTTIETVLSASDPSMRSVPAQVDQATWDKIQEIVRTALREAREQVAHEPITYSGNSGSQEPFLDSNRSSY